MKKKHHRAEVIEGAPLHYAPENEQSSLPAVPKQ